MSGETELSTGQVARQVHLLISVGRFDQAHALAAGALAREPQNPELLYLVAYIAYKCGKAAEAEIAAREAVHAEPGHYGARLLLSALAKAREDPAESERLLIGLLREYPDDAELYASYALLMYETLHIDKAQALAREAIARDPENQSALIVFHLGNLIAGRSKDSESNLAKLVAGHPDSTRTLLALVRHLIADARFRAARRIAIELLQSDPRNENYLVLLKELDVYSHWAMAPLWPFHRFGAWLWYASLIAVVGLVRYLAGVDERAALSLTVCVLGFVLYSQVCPRVLQRILR